MNISTEMTGRQLNVSEWLLIDDLNGPAIAVIGTFEFLFSLPLNLFIILHAVFYHRDCVNKSSTFLLLILAITNLLQVVLYMPFWIIASGAGEWIFRSTDRVRSILCQIHGFLFIVLTFASLHALAIISVDRFLSIVKPHLHKKFMSWKVSLTILIVLFVLDVFLSLSPNYSPGSGTYNWVPSIGGCAPDYAGNSGLVWFHVVQSLIPLCIIAITSAWTFIFTRGFLKQNLMRTKDIVSDERYVEQKHIYAVQIKNLVGIFGTLMIFTALSWIPYYITCAAGLGAGFDSIPSIVYITFFVLFLFTNVSNPMIQICFRKDLLDSVKKILHKCNIHGIKWPSLTVRWRRNNRLTSDDVIMDDNDHKQVPIQYVRAFSAPVVKRELESVDTIRDNMAESYSCGTVDITLPADSYIEHHSEK